MNAPDVKNLTAPAIRLHANDNVLVARTDLAQGAVLAAEKLTCLNRIPAGHKVAARALAKGEPVLKYNTIIGFASADIAPGTLLHRLNMEFREFDRDYAYARDYQPVRDGARDRARDASWASCARTGAWRRAITSASCRP